MSSKIEVEFSQLGRTEKSAFISQHIELASASAVAKYIEDYFFDVFKELDDDKYIAEYLRTRGFRVINQPSTGVYIEKNEGDIVFN